MPHHTSRWRTPPATVNATTAQVRTTFASGRTVNNAGSVVGGLANNATITRTAVGRYRVQFASAHPAGTAYEILLTMQSDVPNRDQRKIAYRDVTANGFNVETTVDDNGGTADIYADIPFSFAVMHEITVVTGV